MAKFLVFSVVLVLALVVRFLTFEPGQKVEIPEGGVVFEATIRQEPRITDKWQVILVSDVRIYTAHYPKWEAGDKVRVEGEVKEGRMYFPEVTKITKEPKALITISHLRNTLADNVDRLLPRNEAALVKGMVLGVDEMPKDLRDKLINTGTIHVVVVSGQNLAIVAGMFLALVKVMGRKFAVILATVAVFLYALLTGFAPPVTRAALMVLASSVAVLAGRELWPIWSLFLAAYFIVFVNPAALFEVSFQLTFAATLGIMTLGKWMGGGFTARGPVSRFIPASARSSKNVPNADSESHELRASGDPFTTATPRVRSFVEMVLKLASVPVSAYVFTAPIIYFYFGRVSWAGPFVNVLVAELVAPVMVLGFVIAGLSLVMMPLAQVAAYLAFVPAWMFLRIVGLFAGYG